VAIKTYTVPEGLSRAQKKESRERFVREARAAAHLAHPGVVTVYDVGEERGVPFFTMEYVPGSTLAQLLDDGPIEADAAFSIACRVVEALSVAHEAGIVHRDVKPANILVRASDGAVKIADFGVARLAASDLTQAGTWIGSPAYMSPEQIRSHKVDGRSDLFSLAAILYEMLCGERPFEGEDVSQLAYSIVHLTFVPISKRVAGLSSALDRFFDRALAKNPDDRFADGAAFRETLREASGRLLEPDPMRTRVVAPLEIAGSKRRSWRRPVSIAVVLAGLLAGWAAFGWNRGAYLLLDAKSSVGAGSFALLIDGEEVYSRELIPQRPRKGFLGKVFKSVETFEALIEVPAGSHEVVGRVVPNDDSFVFQDTVIVDFEPRQTHRLRMTAGHSFGSPLSLKPD
jgi:predicted Ser/Thr protein kinase